MRGNVCGTTHRASPPMAWVMQLNREALAWGYGNGGGRGIRTPEPLSGLTVFKTAGFNRSPIPPVFLFKHLQLQRRC